MDYQDSRPEVRYGVPAADQIIFNYHYITGYSYYFRQAKWVLEIIDQKLTGGVGRSDNFRPDYRIPEMFRADLADYKHSGYDRGHLVASGDQQELLLQNSETFLLSNMSPQKPKFNQGIWLELESAVRGLDALPEILVTFIVSGPIFHFEDSTKFIGMSDKSHIGLPIPSAYFKAVLTEDKRGNLKQWSFILPNEGSSKELASFMVPVKKVELYAGIRLWDNLRGTKIDEDKNKLYPMWKY